MVEPRSIAIRNGLLLALTFAAGYIDALGYLGLGRVFTANMTGNTVLLGIAIAQLDGDAIARASLALAGFVAGVAAGAWIAERDHSDTVWPWSVTLALTLELLLLLVFAVGWYVAQDSLATDTTTAALILLSAIAMGVQSAAVSRLEVTGIATTYLTGTLTNLVVLMLGRSRRKGKPFGHSALRATVWTVYIGGAVVAAVDLSRNLVLALALPVVLVMVVVTIAAIVFRPQ